MFGVPWVLEEAGLRGEWYSAGVNLIPLACAVFGRPSFGCAEVQHLHLESVTGLVLRSRWLRYLCGDDVELEFLPVIVGLFECLNLIRIRPSTEGSNKRNGLTYIGLCPSSHPLPQPLESHLERRDLVRFAQVGLKSDGDVLPGKVLLFFELEQQLLFLVEFDRAGLRRCSLPSFLVELGIIFFLAHSFQSVHLSKAYRVGSDRHRPRSNGRHGGCGQAKVSSVERGGRSLGCLHRRHGIHGWHVVIGFETEGVLGKEKIFDVGPEGAWATFGSGD